MKILYTWLIAAALALFPIAALAQTAEPDALAETEAEAAMTVERLRTILTALDPDIVTDGSRFQITIQDVPVLVVTDFRADRMRAVVPIRSADGMTPEELMRILQANFDTALDARYAVAQGRLWGVFIHPLSSLDQEGLISGIGQTVNIALTYGSLYSGGAVQYGKGDSSGLQRELIDELLKKGEEI